MKRVVIAACLWLSLLATVPLQAATRAWLDRSQVALGESATLSIETDQAAALPDFSPLATDFTLAGQGSSRQVQMSDGRVTTRTTHVINLTPRRAGSLIIPALKVGAENTRPLMLSVGGAKPVATAASNAAAFLETEVDDPNPYVQQSVGVTLRLFYAVPLVSGQLDLESPDGASMQRVGDDVQSARMVNGRRYNVVERRYLLVPDRSGKLVIPGARFQGRSAGGWIDDLIGDGRRELNADGAPRTLEVRPQPADAPQPWLPLRDLRLRYLAAPQGLRAGEAATLVVEAVAQGATQAQMPELPTPSVAGAQVFAEAPQFYETSNGGTPQVRVTRRYSLVPNGAGKLVVPGMKLAWWDVRAAAPRLATVPDLTLPVAAGTGGFAGSQLPSVVDTPSGADPSTALPTNPQAAARYWVWAAVLFAVLWVLTLAWALWRRGTRAQANGAPAGQPRTPLHPRWTVTDLKRALDNGTLDEVADVLRGMSTPPSDDLDALNDKLDSAPQREAVELLRRARWAGGDGVAARNALRTAFSDGPQWRPVAAPHKELLPPLYPRP